MESLWTGATHHDNDLKTLTVILWVGRITPVSLPRCSWHLGLGNSLLWGLPCALEDVQQHPWPLPTRCQSQPPACYDQKCPLGLQSHPWLRASGRLQAPSTAFWVLALEDFVRCYSGNNGKGLGVDFRWSPALLVQKSHFWSMCKESSPGRKESLALVSEPICYLCNGVVLWWVLQFHMECLLEICVTGRVWDLSCSGVLPGYGLNRNQQAGTDELGIRSTWVCLFSFAASARHVAGWCKQLISLLCLSLPHLSGGW